MNTRITFNWTDNYNEGLPNCGFPVGSETVVLGELYSFEDYLNDRYDNIVGDNGEMYGAERDEDAEGFYWIMKKTACVDANGEYYEVVERTNTAYQVIEENATEEEPRDVG